MTRPDLLGPPLAQQCADAVARMEGYGVTVLRNSPKNPIVTTERKIFAGCDKSLDRQEINLYYMGVVRQ